TDTVEHLDRLLGQIAAAGATGCTVVSLHLRPGAREWFFTWLRRERPALVAPYEQIFGRGSYVGAAYRRDLASRVDPLLERHGLRRRGGDAERTHSSPGPPGDAESGFPDGALPSDRTRVPAAGLNDARPGQAWTSHGRRAAAPEQLSLV
ncbi:MAG: radical SAM protein, partial [Actinomycetota bacterium]|nr:radical SAM protein [Actinomycetota bacterium]